MHRKTTQSDEPHSLTKPEGIVHTDFNSKLEIGDISLIDGREAEKERGLKLCKPICFFVGHNGRQKT